VRCRVVLVSRIRTLLAAADGAPGAEVGFRSADSCGCGRDLNVGVGVAPQERESSQPVFCVDQPADASELFGLHYANCSGEFRAVNFPADGARRNLDLRVVADALDFPQFTIRHEVEFVVVLGKPDGRVYCDAALSEGGEADVALAADFGGDGRHADIVKCGEDSCGVVHPDRRIELPRRLFLAGWANGDIQLRAIEAPDRSETI
jgi:hypothetical protein